MKGTFITLEGIEGSGKSTALSYIQQWVQEHLGATALTTREPGGTAVGAELREVAIHADLSPKASMMLFGADRLHHLATKIQPALVAGKVVVCDRFHDSTLAYQGAAGGVSSEVLEAFTHMVLGTFRPDLTIIFDMPVEVSAQRRARRTASDRFERERPEFHNKVREAFLNMAQSDSEGARFRVLDATQDRQGVQRQLDAILTQHFTHRGTS